MDAEEEGMLEAEDGEVEDDSFEGVNVSEEGCVCKPGTALANHSPQRTNMMCVNQEGVDRKSSNFEHMKASPRRDPNAWTGGSQGYKQWTEDEIADDNTGMEKDNTSQSAADTDKEERRRKKKEKKREKKMKREKKRKRSESEELDDDGETLIKKSKPVSTCSARIGQQSSSPLWLNADELEEGEELSEGEDKEKPEDTQSTCDFIANQRAIAEKYSTGPPASAHQSKSSSQKYSYGSSDQKHRAGTDRDRDRDRGKPPRKTRWSPAAYDLASSRDFRDRDQDSSKDSPPSDRRDREASDSADDQRRRSRSKYSKHASSDEDSEVLGGRSSDDVSREDNRNRRRKRWENDEKVSVHDDDSSRRSKRERNERENEREASRGGAKNKYWKKSFGSNWHHEDHDQPVGSPPNLSGKDQDDYAAKLSEYRTSQEKDKIMSKKRKKMEKREGDFDNGNGYGGDWKPCFFHRNGFCKLGPDCDFSHDCEQKVQKKEDVCRPYMHGNCKWGDNCNMLHGQFPCKYHARGLVCYKGDYCLFSHDKPTPYTLQLLEKWLNSNPRHQHNNQNNYNSGPHYSAPPQPNLNNQSYDSRNQNNSRNNNDHSSRSQQGSNLRLPSKWSDHPPPCDKQNNRDRHRDRDRTQDYFDEQEEEGDSKPCKSDRDFGDSSDVTDAIKQYSGSPSNVRSASNQFNNNSNNNQAGVPGGVAPGNFNNPRMTSPGMQRFSLPGMPPVTQAPGCQMTPINYNAPRGPVPNQMSNAGAPPSSASGMLNPNAPSMPPQNNSFVSGPPYNGPPGPNMLMPPPRGVMSNTSPYCNNNQNFNIRGNYMPGNVPPPSSMPYNPNQSMHGPHPPGPQMGGHPGGPPPRTMMGNHPQPNPGMPYNPNMQNAPPTAFMNNLPPQPGFPQNGPPIGHPQRLPIMPGVPLGPSVNPQTGGILPIPRPPGSAYGAYPPVDSRDCTEDDSIDKLVKVKAEPEEDEKPVKVEEALKKTEAQKEGPKLRIETFPSEVQSSRPASNTPTTPTPVLHKGTQLIPIENLDNSIKDPRVSKGFVSSSIYFDISSRPVKISVQTVATAQDGAQVSCAELIPWRLPLKVDFAKMFMNSLTIDTMSSSPVVPESHVKTPTRPTDPRKRSSSNSSKSQNQPSSPKTQSPPLGDRNMSSPYGGTESAKPLSPLASPIASRSLSSESENPPSPVTPGPELFSRLDSYTPTEVKTEPVLNSVKIEPEANSPEVSPEKASPSGLTPFVLPSESLSPNKADFDPQIEGQKYLGSYMNKPKASLSIAEYMKRRKASRNSGEALMEQEKSDSVLAATKCSESLMGEISDNKVSSRDVDMSNNPYDLGNESMAAIPSFKDLFKDPTASPFG